LKNKTVEKKIKTGWIPACAGMTYQGIRNDISRDKE